MNLCFSVLFALQLAVAVTSSQSVCDAGACEDDDDDVHMIQVGASTTHRDDKPKAVALDNTTLNMKTMYFIDTLVRDTCAQTLVNIPSETKLALIETKEQEKAEGGCSWWRSYECSGTVSTAIAGCGVLTLSTLGVGAFPCFIAAADAVEECKPCFCDMISDLTGGDWSCQRIGISAVSSPALGTCADAGYTKPAGKYMVEHAPITGMGVTFALFKKL